jgi:hypothetical protein
MAIHIGGHAGYEVAPFIPTLEAAASLACLGWRRPAGALNTVRHHDMHHRHPKSHFSLYFTIWDRACGTEHPQYRAAVAEHFAGGSQGGTGDDSRGGSRGGAGGRSRGFAGEDTRRGAR